MCDTVFQFKYAIWSIRFGAFSANLIMQNSGDCFAKLYIHILIWEHLVLDTFATKGCIQLSKFQKIYLNFITIYRNSVKLHTQILIIPKSSSCNTTQLLHHTKILVIKAPNAYITIQAATTKTNIISFLSLFLSSSL